MLIQVISKYWYSNKIMVLKQNRKATPDINNNNNYMPFELFES